MMRWLTHDLAVVLVSILVLTAGTATAALAKASEVSPDLVVMLHAYTKSAADLELVRQAIRESGDYSDADILAPDLPFDLLSMAKPEEVVADLLAQIDHAWNRRAFAGNPYRRILLVGHSMGSLYARKLYVAACGENPEAPFEPELKARLRQQGLVGLEQPRPWASAVQRIVLLAGMNRGWSISHHMSLTRALEMQAGVALGRVLSWFEGHLPIIFSIRRGAPFITQLRLQWLAMLRASRHKQVGEALTVQLLGSVDDLVSPEDNVDLITGKDFVYLDVPFSGHENVVRMDEHTLEGRARRAVMQLAVAATPENLKAHQVLPADTMFEPESDVTDVVFVIHGIRDEGFWTHKIARRVIAKGREQGREIRSVTSSYGYFPMLSFLRPGARQEKVEWLMDQYTEARARYPNARTFTFVGHSNGTYLAAEALRNYPAARFDRIVFAGSVVGQEYEWKEFIPAQTGGVLNFVASADWVVAFFPKTLEILGSRDLGSAGHDGFVAGAPEPPVLQPRLYVVGGHSAALQEKLWDAVAGFLLTGTLQLPSDLSVAENHPWWIQYPAMVAPLIWVLIAALVIWLLYRIIRLDIAEWKKTVAVIAYVGLIWVVLTEV